MPSGPDLRVHEAVRLVQIHLVDLYAHPAAPGQGIPGVRHQVQEHLLHGAAVHHDGTARA
jgi:hypothetical protein